MVWLLQWCHSMAAGLLPAPACSLCSRLVLSSPSWLGSSRMSPVQPTPVPTECFNAMFFFTSKMVGSSTSGIHRCCAPLPPRHMNPFRPCVPSAFPFNEVLFWAEDREAIPVAGQLHHFLQAEETSSVPGGTALAGLCLMSHSNAHLVPLGCTLVLLGAKPKLPISSPS